MKKWILSLLCLSVFSCFAYALNLSEMDNISRAIARDPIPVNGTPRVSEVIVSSYINVAQQEIAMFTWCTINTVNFPVVTGQKLYPFTSDMVSIQHLMVDTVTIPGTSISVLDKNSNGTWQQNMQFAAPTVYYSDSISGQIGFDTILSTAYNKTITVTYIQMPSNLSNPTDVPFNGITRYIPFHMAICYYVAALICYTDNRPTEGDRYYKLYSDRVTNMSATIRLSPDYFPVFGGNNNNNIQH